MNNPKITVLMPVYNGERYLCKSIDSVLSQTFKDFEFLIINDGSTDGTAQILNSYSDSRIKITNHAHNIGLTKSLNEGLKLAQGKYIARMDADDISLPHRLEKQLEYMEKHPFCLVLGTYADLIDDSGKIYAQHNHPRDFKNIHKAMLVKNPIVHGSIIARRKALLQIGGYNETYRYSQDLDLWLRLCEAGNISIITGKLYRLRFWNGYIPDTKKALQDQYAAQARRNAVCRRKNKVKYYFKKLLWALHI